MRYKKSFVINASNKHERITYSRKSLYAVELLIKKLLSAKTHDFEVSIVFTPINSKYSELPIESELWGYEYKQDNVFKYRQHTYRKTGKISDWYIKRLRPTMVKHAI